MTTAEATNRLGIRRWTSRQRYRGPRGILDLDDRLRLLACTHGPGCRQYVYFRKLRSTENQLVVPVDVNFVFDIFLVCVSNMEA